MEMSLTSTFTQIWLININQDFPGQPDIEKGRFNYDTLLAIASIGRTCASNFLQTILVNECMGITLNHEFLCDFSMLNSFDS